MRDKKKHIKTAGKETRTDLRTDIQRTCEELDIPSTYFSKVDMYEWPQVEKNIWNAFTARPGSGWKWNYLKVPYFSFMHPHGHTYLSQLTGDNERAWFIAEDVVNGKTKFWLYEGKITAIEMILSELYQLRDFYVVSKKYDWMLCFNHEDMVIGTGKMIQKLQLLERDLYQRN